MVLVVTTQLCHCKVKAATDSDKEVGVAVFNNTIYKNRNWVEFCQEGIVC